MADRLVSDRRAVLMGLGIFGAAAAAPLTLNAVQAGPTEPARLKVNRLAEELSLALDEWMGEMPAGAHWVATVHPASRNDYPVAIRNARTTPIERMDAATKEFVAAAKALDPKIVAFQRVHDIETGACVALWPEYPG